MAERTYRHRECRTCPRVFLPTGPRGVYCPTCRVSRAVSRALTGRGRGRSEAVTG